MSELISKAGIRTLAIFVPFVLISLMSGFIQQITESAMLRVLSGIAILAITLLLAIRINDFANRRDSSEEKTQRN